MNWYKKAQLNRREIAAGLKELGLPATGATERMARLLDVASRPPNTWSREDFELVLPHIWIHQDFRGHDDEAVGSIMEEGLEHGMVDTLKGVAGRGHSFAPGLVGGHAYLFWPGHLNWKRDTGWLNPGSKPFHHFVSQKGQDVYEAVAGG